MEAPPIHVLLALDAQILGGEAEISTPTVTESSTDEGSSRSTTGNAGEVRAPHVRAAPAPDRTARPPPVIAPPAPPPAPTPRALGPPPAPRAVVPRARPGRPSPPSAPLPPATRSHVASTASAWVAACTDLLEAAKDRTNMRGLREPLVSRGFQCGSEKKKDRKPGTVFTVTVPPDFPCYYDVIGKDYSSCTETWLVPGRDYANSLTALRKYLEGALTLARASGAYRTDAEYKPRAPLRGSGKTSRFTGVSWNENGRYWVARISVRRSQIELGLFHDEEDAARAYDAALVKYRGKPTVNFPGEAPLAEVLAALPAAPPPPPSAEEIQLRRELQQLRRENKRLKTKARGGNWTVTSTYYTGGNGTVASRQSRRSSRAPEHRRLRAGVAVPPSPVTE